MPLYLLFLKYFHDVLTVYPRSFRFEPNSIKITHLQHEQLHEHLHRSYSHRRPFAETLVREISLAHQQVAERVVDWWLDKMPEA